MTLELIIALAIVYTALGLLVDLFSSQASGNTYKFSWWFLALWLPVLAIAIIIEVCYHVDRAFNPKGGPK